MIITDEDDTNSLDGWPVTRAIVREAYRFLVCDENQAVPAGQAYCELSRSIAPQGVRSAVHDLTEAGSSVQVRQPGSQLPS